LFWAIDLKFGLSDIISNLKFNEFLRNQTKSFVFNNTLGGNLKKEKDINADSSSPSPNTSQIINPNNPNYFSFTLTSLIHPNVSNIKMKDLVHYFRTEMLVYDLEKKSGVVFNLPDILQCGMIGISGTSNNYRDCIKLMDNSTSLIKSLVYTKEYKPVFSDSRSDMIELSEVIGKVKMFIKYSNKEILH
jgi:hypothetical protein